MHAPLHHDPPRTLAVRLEQLNDNLQSLGGRLKDAIATAASTAVAEAIHDAIRHLLGSRDGPTREQRFQQRSDVLGSRDGPTRERPYNQRSDSDDGLYYQAEEPRWPDDDGFWPELQDSPRERHGSEVPKRWQHALGLAIRTALWWVCQVPCRRPILTVTTVAVAAGITAFLAGPTLAAGVGVLATTANLFMTADAASIASNQLSSLVAG